MNSIITVIIIGGLTYIWLLTYYFKLFSLPLVSLLTVLSIISYIVVIYVCGKVDEYCVSPCMIKALPEGASTSEIRAEHTRLQLLRRKTIKKGIWFTVGSIPIVLIFGALVVWNQGPLAFQELKVSDAKARPLINAARSSPIRVQGLSDIPTNGRITIVVAQDLSKEKWDPSVTLSAFWETAERSVEWDFQERDGKPLLVCWSEWQHSPFLVMNSFVNEGKPFYEQLRITSGTGGSCGVKTGFVVEHWSAAGIHVIPADTVPAVVAEWRTRKGTGGSFN